MALKTSTILKRAMGFIEKGWTQGAMARDADGERADYAGPKAVCWCSLGALSRAYARADRVTAARVVDLMRDAANSDIVSWNDAEGRRKSTILAGFRKAIKLAERQESQS